MTKNKFSKKQKAFAFFLSVLTLSFAANYFVSAWTEPSIAPAGCVSGTPGCDAPINVSVTGQYKEGKLQIGGTSSPFNTLEIGDFSSGIPVPGSPLGTLVTTGGAIINTGDGAVSSNPGLLVPYGDVGIGTTSPNEKLEVNGNTKISGNLNVKNIINPDTYSIRIDSQLLSYHIMNDRAKGGFAVFDSSPLGALEIGNQNGIAGVIGYADPTGLPIPHSPFAGVYGEAKGDGYSGWFIGGNGVKIDGTINLKELGSAPGATTDYSKLYVKTDGNLYYKDDAGTEFNIGGTSAGSNSWAVSGNDIYNTNTGDVGIGTATPGRKLEVNGDGSISNILVSQIEGGLYYGRVGVRENQLALSNVGANWVPRDSVRYWSDIAMSSDGKYQTASAQNSQIYTSSDYGANWTPRDSTRNWMSVAMSSDGKYQTAASDVDWIYTSSDYGANWTPRDSVKQWYSIAMSSDGKYQTAGVVNGQIYTSSDYGANWTPRDSSRWWTSIAISSDGKYQTASVENDNIYTSSDYGASWTPRDSLRHWYAVAMSSDGKYQTAGGSSTNIYTSSDYGVNWTPRNSSRSWTSIAMSSDGKYQTASVEGGRIYTSSNYGVNWTPRDSARSWKCVAMSSDGKYQTAAEFDGQIYTSYADSYMPGGNVGIGTVTPSEKLEVNGGVRLNTTDAKPACDATKRGTLWFAQGVAGVKDSLEVCAKDAADAYAWRTIY